MEGDERMKRKLLRCAASRRVSLREGDIDSEVCALL